MAAMTETQKSPIEQAVLLMNGPSAAARVCNVTPQAVYKWLRKKRLPRTDWTGETQYAAAIAAHLGGQITVQQLHAVTVVDSAVPAPADQGSSARGALAHRQCLDGQSLLPALSSRPE